ncbi:MAG: hypothetical protein BroJett040_19620 [Oligoflexia bacterium]|nr:MAG: hypothetical protein BroJett040_19620 [Oligoflexia bacterium]
MKNVPLFVLAGGKATRLKHLSVDRPKYLMPVSDHETFADYHLKWARQQNFDHVILSLGHLAQQVVDYCGDGSKWGLKISYLFDGDHPLGTGGATRESLKFDFDYLAVTYGDTILSLNAQDCIQKTIQAKALACMTVYENKVQGHTCNANFDGQKIIYDKASPLPNWNYIDYGFLVLSRKFIENFENRSPLDLADPLSQASKNGQLMGYLCNERFWEIGSPEALQEFQLNFK